MRVPITSVKQGCLWIESHAEKAVKTHGSEWKGSARQVGLLRDGKRHMYVYVRHNSAFVQLRSSRTAQVRSCSCSCCSCCCCCNASYFRIFVGPKKLSRRWCFRIFWHSRSKNTVNTNVFGLGSQTPWYLRCFFGSKKHGIYNVFGPGLAKTLVFTQFSACCKM